MTSDFEPRPSLFAGLVLALDLIADHVVLLDQDGRIVHANVAWQRFALDNGDEDTDWVGVDYVAASAAPAIRAGIADPITEGVREVLLGRKRSFACEYDCHAPDEMRWFRMSVTRTQLPGISAIVTHSDITAQRLAERVLERHATHDPDTGLANRAALERHLQQMLDERQEPSAIMVVLRQRGRPLDPIDDGVLETAAETLRELFPAPARVGRWGPRSLLIAQSGVDDETLTTFEGIAAATLREFVDAVDVTATALRIRGAEDITQLADGDRAQRHGG